MFTTAYTITVKRLFFIACGLIVAVFLSSWIAGQCKTWSKPKEVPAQIDTGVPTATPVNTAPTVTECFPLARPDLTKEEELAVLAKYGIKPHITPVGVRSSQTPAQVSTMPENALDPLQIAPADMSKIIPMAETTFTHEASGVSVDVLASVDGFGSRIQQKATWHPWKPPITVTQDGDWLENEARWEKFIMLGYVGMVNHNPDGTNQTDAAPGLGFGLAYKSWRASHATFEARTIGMVTMDGDGAAIGGLSVSW